MADDDCEAITVNHRITAQRMPNGAVLMDTLTGDCFELNQIGAEVWDEIDRRGAISGLAERFAARYGVDKGRVDVDLRDLLAAMVRRGIVSVR